MAVSPETIRFDLDLDVVVQSAELVGILLAFAFE